MSEWIRLRGSERVMEVEVGREEEWEDGLLGRCIKCYTFD